jgi:phosphoribosylanthranilate isomerase
MKKTRVKICGVTRAEDANLAVELGAWALGFIFYKKSLRSVRAQEVLQIRLALTAPVLCIGVFVNSSVSEIAEAVSIAGLDGVQLHGNESPEFCKKLGELLPDLRIFKAIRVTGLSELQALSDYENCEAVLLDSFATNSYGGNGQTFAWDLASQFEFAQPVIVAGGLNSENVENAIRTFRPFAVDVSSGVEISAGIKDHKRLREFFKTVRTLA